MSEQRGVFVERMRDEGQWFDRGVRVEYFPTGRERRRQNLEKAALGSYEVLRCDRVEADDGRWLDVRLRRLAHT